MNIYSFPTFNLSKILITAEELNQDYELHLLDPSKGEHKSPEHMARHPLGKVPAIELDGEFFIESNNICRLLAEENNNKLYADSAKQRAVINGWIDLMGYHIGRWLVVNFFEDAIRPHLDNTTRKQDQVDEANGFLEIQLPVMNEALGKNEFLAGNAITIADTIAFAYCQTTEHSSVNFDNYPNIQKWFDAMNNRDAVKHAMAKLPNGSINPFG